VNIFTAHRYFVYWPPACSAQPASWLLGWPTEDYALAAAELGRGNWGSLNGGVAGGLSGERLTPSFFCHSNEFEQKLLGPTKLERRFKALARSQRQRPRQDHQSRRPTGKVGCAL